MDEITQISMCVLPGLHRKIPCNIQRKEACMACAPLSIDFVCKNLANGRIGET